MPSWAEPNTAQLSLAQLTLASSSAHQWPAGCGLKPAQLGDLIALLVLAYGLRKLTIALSASCLPAHQY